MSTPNSFPSNIVSQTSQSLNPFLDIQSMQLLLIIIFKVESRQMSIQIGGRTLRQRYEKWKQPIGGQIVKVKSKIKEGHWRNKEQAKYLSFLRKYYFIMKNSLLRYHYRIFTKMAEEIGTRNAIQCKSHHQKMLKKSDNSLQNIIFAKETNQGHTDLPERKSYIVNEYQQVKEGVQNVQTNDKLPWFIVQTTSQIVMVIDDRYVSSY